MFGKGKNAETAQPVEYPEPQGIAEQAGERALAQKKLEEYVGGDPTNFARYILEEDNIPKAVRTRFTLFFSKVFALTNIRGDEDIWLFKILFEIAVLEYRIYTPHYEQTVELEVLISMMRAYFFGQLYRALGGHLRERALFPAMITVSDKAQPEQRKGGLFSRIFKGGT